MVKYRSGYENLVADYLSDNNVSFDYEPFTFPFTSGVRSSLCGDCGSNNILKERWYTPDFILENGIVIEAKGNFKPTNRTTLLAVLDTCDDISRDNFRILFQRNNTFGKSKITYADWCVKNNIKFHVSVRGEVPEEWYS